MTHVACIADLYIYYSLCVTVLFKWCRTYM